MLLRAGTSGYSYPEWRGGFYPEKFPTGKMLEFYAERLSTVEINNTFYRMPKREVLENWGAQVPEDFRFVLKASRRITHMSRLRDAGDSVAYLWEQAQVLGPKLGPILFQLPPNMRLDLERLGVFLRSLPKGCRGAFEFRHPSWQDQRVFDLLGTSGCSFCTADPGLAGESSETELVSTTDWGYLRLRRVDYSDEELRAWAERIAVQNWEQAYVFFKHEDEATAPALARKLSAIMTDRRENSGSQPENTPR